MVIDAEMLPTWKQVVSPECEPLLSTVASLDPADATQMSRLRRDWSLEQVTIAVELVRARTKGASKFADATQLVADVQGVEQATSEIVALHKTCRFRQAGAERILDLCCGVGGDARALVDVAPVTAVDLNAVRAWMTERNAGCATRVGDVAECNATDHFVHLDPARRAGERRAWRLTDYQPGPEVIAALVAQAQGTAVKLGPGVDPDDVESIAPAAELEFISDAGALVQAVAWTGAFVTDATERIATRLPDGATRRGRPSRELPCGPTTFGSVLHVPDPALERAALVGALAEEMGLVAPEPRLGLLTSDAPIDSPWFTSFEVLAEMPWRVPRVKQWLREHDAGLVEVKTRGGAVNTDRTQRELRGKGDTPYVVFGLRLGKAVRAVVCTRQGRLSAFG